MLNAEPRKRSTLRVKRRGHLTLVIQIKFDGERGEEMGYFHIKLDDGVGFSKYIPIILCT